RVAFSPDGQLLATGGGTTLKLWDAASGREIHTLRGHTRSDYDYFPLGPGGVTSVAFSPDGLVLASTSGDTTVKIWDTRSGEGIRTLLGHTAAVTSVTFSPDGQWLASSSCDNTVKVWERRTDDSIRTLRGHELGVTGVGFSPDGELLASTSFDNTVKIWDTR